MPSHLLLSHTAEYNQLFDALPVAIKRACETLQHSGGAAQAYLAADMEVSRILARITGFTNEHLRAPDDFIATSSQLLDLIHSPPA